MQYTDLVNGLLEGLIVSIFIFLNLKAILKDKKVRGFTLSSVIFFFVWSVWNLFYYKSLNQPFSTWSVFTATIFGVGADFLVFYYYFLEVKNTKENKKIRLMGLIVSIILFIFLGLFIMSLGHSYSKTVQKWPDALNSLFEYSGAVVIIGNCLKLIKQKEFKGSSIWGIVFNISCGGWNLFYYFHLNQYFSWVAGLSIFIAHCWWIYLILYYRYKEKISKIQIIYRIKRS